ncbi:hypothetical protein BJ912DRAFT_538710 [Pholiota molesta]|nr:hypothetical protein BJ912DRAFT_538710 [Pholiota molesta]
MTMPHLDLIARKVVYKRNSTTETSANATSFPNPNVHLIITFDVLHATGVALLLAILLVAYLSPKIRRKSTWYMVVVAWIVISLSNLMLLGEQTGPEPGTAICFVQTMFVYALPPFAIAYVAAFMIDAYLTLERASKSLSTSRTYRLDNIFLHGIPTTVLFAILIEVFMVGSSHPEEILRHEDSGMYCHFSGSLPRNISAVLAICGVAVIYILVALIFIKYRRWSRKIKAVDQSSTAIGFSVDVFVRMVVFSSLSVIVLAIAFNPFIPSQRAVVASGGAILQATLPFFAALILGTQRDIICAVRCLWRRDVTPLR